MRVEEISFCEASTRLFLWKKAFLLYLAPMIIFPFKIFLRDTRNRMETEREHNGHLFSNRIGVIGVATEHGAEEVGGIWYDTRVS